MKLRLRHVLLLGVAGVVLVGGTRAVGLWGGGGGSQGEIVAAPVGEPLVRVELRSWVVFGRGRHLYALVHWPGEAEAEVVEYWSTARWPGYAAPGEERGERIAKMPRGMVVRPTLVEQIASDRHEAEWEIALSRAEVLASERMFEERYLLLGPNSTSGLRAAFRAAGLEFPARIIHGAGMWGEFPGVDLAPGREIERARWGMFGVSPAVGRVPAAPVGP